MITVWDGGLGYAATPDLSSTGLQRAIQQARDWARATAGRTLVGSDLLDRQVRVDEYHSPVRLPWSSLPLAGKLDLLRQECARLKQDEAIVEWQAGLWHSAVETLYLTADGSCIAQQFEMLLPSLSATATATVRRKPAVSGAVLIAGRAGWKSWPIPVSTTPRRPLVSRRWHCWRRLIVRPGRWMWCWPRTR